MDILLAFAMGFLWDLLVGDPSWLPHPVVFIGRLVSWIEAPIRRICSKTKRGERFGGGLLVLLVCAVSLGIPWVLLIIIRMISPLAALLLNAFWCGQILAVKSLRTESRKVYDALRAGDLPKARKMVSYIVGRDTQSLSKEGVIKATVETVAENTTDGIVAPMVYLILGGAPLGMFYKAVNTMDSMIGYQNERYRYFGTAAARLDDLANYLPARFAGLLMVATACLAGQDCRGAWQIWRRDRRQHKSPNSGQTESACAGALGIQLAGNAFYFGELVEKSSIGDATRPIEAEDICRTHRMMDVCAVSSFLLLGTARFVLTVM